jgi:dextranase
MEFVEITPTRGSYSPGETVTLEAVLSAQAPGPAHLRVEIRHLADAPETIEQALTLTAGEQTVLIEWVPPDRPAGYSVRAEAWCGDGAPACRATTAFDVLPHWTAFPRYGFLSDFGADRPDPEQTIRDLTRYHINGLQFYDWQYRHDQLLPPEETYVDPLGRRLSLDSIRALTAAAHRHGLAALPYLAVYAASAPFWRSHPAWALRDVSGAPIPFGEDFLGLMNPAADSPWVPHLLDSARQVLQAIPFDGLHIDQYGEPKQVWNERGEAVDLPRAFVDFIRRAREEHPDRTILFNAVGNWPIEALAEAPLDFLYIEVWPPDVGYGALARIVLDAVRLTGGKAVVIALYLPSDRPANVLLADAVILACGGMRIELGEGVRLLADPYFPKHQAIDDGLRADLRRFYDFAVRSGEWLKAYHLSGADLQAWSNAELDQEFISGVASVWSVRRTLPEGEVLSLINLTGLENPRWDQPHTAPRPCKNLKVRIPCSRPPAQVFWSCPEQADDPQPLAFEHRGETLHLEIPLIHYSGLVTIHD